MGYRGFTLIELLVVIAIIGLLSSIVLSSMHVTLDKANDASIKEEMAQMRTAAQLYYSANTNYGSAMADDDLDACMGITNGAGTVFDVANPNGIGNLVASVQRKSKTGGNVRVLCNVGTDHESWAFAAPLLDTSSSQLGWCVDASGSAKVFSGSIIMGGATALTQSGTARCP